jgi:hypothetical protein
MVRDDVPASQADGPQSPTLRANARAARPANRRLTSSPAVPPTRTFLPAATGSPCGGRPRCLLAANSPSVIYPVDRPVAGTERCAVPGRTRACTGFPGFAAGVSERRQVQGAPPADGRGTVARRKVVLIPGRTWTIRSALHPKAQQGAKTERSAVQRVAVHGVGSPTGNSVQALHQVVGPDSARRRRSVPPGPAGDGPGW